MSRKKNGKLFPASVSKLLFRKKKEEKSEIRVPPLPSTNSLGGGGRARRSESILSKVQGARTTPRVPRVPFRCSSPEQHRKTRQADKHAHDFVTIPFQLVFLSAGEGASLWAFREGAFARISPFFLRPYRHRLYDKIHQLGSISALLMKKTVPPIVPFIHPLPCPKILCGVKSGVKQFSAASRHVIFRILQFFNHARVASFLVPLLSPGHRREKDFVETEMPLPAPSARGAAAGKPGSPARAPRRTSRSGLQARAQLGHSGRSDVFPSPPSGEKGWGEGGALGPPVIGSLERRLGDSHTNCIPLAATPAFSLFIAAFSAAASFAFFLDARSCSPPLKYTSCSRSHGVISDFSPHLHDPLPLPFSSACSRS